jgi:hypothetical protein
LAAYNIPVSAFSGAGSSSSIKTGISFSKVSSVRVSFPLAGAEGDRDTPGVILYWPAILLFGVAAVIISLITIRPVS